MVICLCLYMCVYYVNCYILLNFLYTFFLKYNDYRNRSARLKKYKNKHENCTNTDEISYQMVPFSECKLFSVEII